MILAFVGNSSAIQTPKGFNKPSPGSRACERTLGIESHLNPTLKGLHKVARETPLGFVWRRTVYLGCARTSRPKAEMWNLFEVLLLQDCCFD
jgi:hypothetical protein